MKNMNAVERESWRYRFDRMFKEEPTLEERLESLEKSLKEQPEFVGKQWDIINQLRSNQIDLRKTLYTLKEKETNVKRKRKSYKY